MSRLMICPVFGRHTLRQVAVWLAIAIAFGGDVSTGQDPSQPKDGPSYFVDGTVTSRLTGDPVAGATITLLVASEQDPAKRMLLGVTDASGKYRISVPMGQVKLWFPPCKPGFWLKHDQAMQSLATSPDDPVVTCDLTLESGATWRVKVDGNLKQPFMRYVTVMEIADDQIRADYMRGKPVQFDESPEQSSYQFGEDGIAYLTEVGESRKYLIGIVDRMGELIVDDGFDNANVVSVEPAEPKTGRDGKELSSVRLVDKEGRKATVSGVEVSLDGGVPLFTVSVKERRPIGVQRLLGQVVGKDKKAIAGVRVGLSRGTKGRGSASQGKFTETDDQGRFEFEIEQFEKTPGRQYSVALNTSGYAARDSAWIDVTDGYEPIDFGQIQLREGFSASVLVTDQAGKAAAGAVIEPSGGYALRALATRTDAQGRATLKDLPEGLVRVYARHGDQTRSTKLIVTKENEGEPTTIRLAPLAPRTDRPLPPKLAVGELAPELQDDGWSDGKDRKLADLKGKVVVLDFWGVWCGPCVSAIPAMQQLADRYQDEEVVFLGIHTAEGNVDGVNKLKKLKGWKTPTAIDRGTTVTDGATCAAYGVTGFPTIIMVDRDGRIAFRSDIMPGKDRESSVKIMEDLAKENGLTLPGPDTPREEAEAIMTRFQLILFGRQIDRLLDPDTKSPSSQEGAR